MYYKKEKDTKNNKVESLINQNKSLDGKFIVTPKDCTQKIIIEQTPKNKRVDQKFTITLEDHT
jgi:hypothetical protein